MDQSGTVKRLSDWMTKLGKDTSKFVIYCSTMNN